MGVYSRGRCYSEESEAVDALFSNSTPSLSGDCLMTLNRQESGWVVNKQCLTETTSYSAAAPTFPICNPADSLYDGLILGWGVVTVWIAAWSIKVLRRAL